jgi:hypothetical protein
MYKVIPVEEYINATKKYLLTYTLRNNSRWLVVHEGFVYEAYCIPDTNLYIISTHVTKGAADKACRRLNREENISAPKSKHMPYHLHMNEKQAQIIIHALDLYSRIGMGQLEEVVTILRQNINGSNKDTLGKLEEVGRLIREASSYWMGGAGSYYGINSEQISDSFRIAWDLQQVVRYRLAWDRNPEGGIQVIFDDPIQTSKEPFALITKD